MNLLRRLLRPWLLFAIFLAAIGWWLHNVTAPLPRCTVTEGDEFFLSGDGAHLVTWSLDANKDARFVKLWDTTTGAEKGVFFRDAGPGARLSLDLWRQRRLVLTNGRTMSMVDLDSWREWSIHLPGDPWTSSPSGKYIVCSEDKLLHLVNTETGQVIHSFRGWWPEFTSDNLLRYVDVDRSASVTVCWNIAERKVAWELTGMQWQFGEKSMDGRYMLARADDGPEGVWYWWDLVKGTRKSFMPDEAARNALACLVCNDRWIVVYDYNRCGIWDPATLQKRGEIRITNPILHVVGGSTRYFAVDDSATLHVVDPESLAIVKTADVTSLLGERDLEFVFESQNLLYRDAKRFRFHDLEGKKPAGECPVNVSISAGSYRPIAITADGRHFHGAFHRSDRSQDDGIFSKWISRLLTPQVGIQRQWVTVGDIESRSVLLEVPSAISGEHAVSDDGRTVVVSRLIDGGSWVFDCWDVPPRKNWTAIVGLPLGTFVVAWLVRLSRRLYLRRTTTPTQSASL